MLSTDKITIGENAQNSLSVFRLGYGTMRLTGEGIYGEPPNRKEALSILGKTKELGIQFLDTADYYGEDVTNRLIAEALYPYAPDLVICTKVGATRKPDKSWIPFNQPANIRTSIENNLRTLRLDRLSLVHFRVMPSSPFPLEASLETMFRLQEEGKILHVGVSNVSRNELLTAMRMGTIATVENMYGHGQRTTLKMHNQENRGGEEVLDICEQNRIPLIPYFSLVNSLDKKDTRVAEIAGKKQVTEAQIQIAWLLHRSSYILPIPGTSSLHHFTENCRSTEIRLSREEMDYLA